MDRTFPFPTWLAVYYVGLVISLFLGFLNPYIRKKDKQLAKSPHNYETSEDRPPIPIRVHLNETWIIVIALITVIVSSILFFKNSFIPLSNAILNGIMGKVLAIVVFAVGFLSFGMIIMLAPLTADMLVRDRMISYYKKRYGVTLKDYREIESKKR